MTAEDRLQEAMQHAREAGLRYVYDSEPGFIRKRSGKGFTYKTGDGKAVDPAHITRCKKLAVPPAWENVWICKRQRPYPGHRP